jgi:hypothetical protein
MVRLRGDTQQHVFQVLERQLGDRFAAPLIDDREYATRTAIGERIVHEVHAPQFGRARRRRRRAPVQRHVLAPPPAHPQLQAVKAVQPPRPERALVASRGAAVPRRATELRQLAGPYAADREGGLHPRGQLAALNPEL